MVTKPLTVFKGDKRGRSRKTLRDIDILMYHGKSGDVA